nr:IclR family transcriptional regulator [Ardenticatena sp.]
MPNTKAGQTVQSVERALAILKTFSNGEPELSVSQISSRLKMPKSTVSRLLATLQAHGFVVQDAETGRFRLGAELIALVHSAIAGLQVHHVARPHLRQLANTLGETVSLSVLDGHDAVNLEQFVPTQRLVMRVGWVGRRMPAHAVSVGKVLLAFLPSEELDQLLDQQMEPLTPNTITNPTTLRRELHRIRQQGYATAFEEFEEGLHAISAPIHDHTGRVIAAISVSGPAYRLTRERIADIIPTVLETAQRISWEMGYMVEETNR